MVFGALGQVGEGRIDAAREAFRNLHSIAPRLVEARLAGRWLSDHPDYRIHADTFFRVAAGRLSPVAADALR